MLRALAFLIGLVILSDALVAASGLPVPGPAVGLGMLVAGFAWRGGAHPALERLFDVAAPLFPLFFVPAAVGVVAHRALLGATWPYVVAAIVFGTAVTLVVTGQLTQALLAILARRTRDA